MAVEHLVSGGFYLARGQKENPWGPQVLPIGFLPIGLPIGFLSIYFSFYQ